LRYLPLFVDLKDKPVLIVGGGLIAARKAELLLEAGARVSVVAPQLVESLRALSTDGRIEHIAGKFCADHISGRHLVIAATGRAEVNRAVASAAQTLRVWANVVDDAALSTAVVPAIIDRSPLLVAVSSGGTAPMLARAVRERVETMLDHGLGALATFLDRWREMIRARLPDLSQRRAVYSRILRGPIARLAQRGQPKAADAAMQELLTPGAQSPLTGRVLLVGAGPGDPGLLTLNALRALQDADVILYDRLVSVEVLALARRDAERVNVGKCAGAHGMSQQAIHALMAERVARGETVVRLKGGDPLTFGRGGEEMLYLREHGIEFEVVPGVTAALACAAYAGIPLTHRAVAESVRFITAHCRESLDQTDWRALASNRETLAIYMGVSQLERVVSELRRHGRASRTPIAIIENGSNAAQRVFKTTLGGVLRIAGQHALRAPALFIVGEVADFAERLHWFGEPPLIDAAGAPRALQHSA
jgi:uroporphyrin-III C-methyltransferase / precorrin-2 dehydrogenase / sirohydrochlorin ferrochelatase